MSQRRQYALNRKYDNPTAFAPPVYGKATRPGWFGPAFLVAMRTWWADSYNAINWTQYRISHFTKNHRQSWLKNLWLPAWLAQKIFALRCGYSLFYNRLAQEQHYEYHRRRGIRRIDRLFLKAGINRRAK